MILWVKQTNIVPIITSKQFQMRNRLKNNYLLLFLFIFINCNYSQAQEKFNSSALQEDLTILKNITTQLSPKLTDKDRLSIDSLAEIKHKELEEEAFTTLEFGNFLSEINFHTKLDEHASLSITEEVITPLLNHSDFFPLPIKIISDCMVVINSTETELPYGSIIRSINGICLDSLLKSFNKNYEHAYEKRETENQFSITYLIKKGSFEAFQIEYSSPLEPSINLEKTMAGIDFDTYKEVFLNTVYPLNKNKLHNLINTHYYQEDSTYYLQLNRFTKRGSLENDFSKFLKSEQKEYDIRFKSIFKEISDLEAKNLIIDLRFNPGGNVTVPGTLFKYIAQEKYNEDIRVEIQNFDFPNVELIKEIDGREIDEPDKLEHFVDRQKKRFEEKNDSVYIHYVIKDKNTRPSRHAFKGQVYLLVGGRSASASSYFAALFKSTNRGTIVGEEMGGSCRSLTAGHFLTYQLPNSKIEVRMPLMVVSFSDQLYQNIEMDKIIPDLIFDENESYNYFLETKDIEIEKVLELIREN